jgi:hypothetical protein
MSTTAFGVRHHPRLTIANKQIDSLCCSLARVIAASTTTSTMFRLAAYIPIGHSQQVEANLLTLKTHVRCQKAYQRDEEYFFKTLLPNALQSSVGTLLAADFKALINPEIFEGDCARSKG